MNKNYRGPAESKELSEDGPAIDQADKGSAKKGHHKKGGAKYKKGAGDYDVKKGSHGHPHGAAQMNSSELLEYGKKLKEKQKQRQKDEKNEKINAGMLDSIMIDHDKGSKAAIEKYGKQYGQRITGEKGELIGRNMEKGLIDVSDEDMKFYRTFAPDQNQGAGRMGYTQNFGPARGNSYARGAAKVNEIMGKGASKQKYGGNKGDESRSKRDYEG